MGAVAIDLQIADEVAGFYADPLGFVLWAYPWGEEGPLRDRTGPDAWQRRALQDIARQVKERRFNGKDPVKPIRQATSSGHGIGKSTLAAWLVDWIMSTRPFARGTITAQNELTQPIRAMRSNCGISTTSAGIISVATTNSDTSALPGNLCLAST